MNSVPIPAIQPNLLLDVDQAAAFLRSYLNCRSGLPHHTVVFYDRDWVGQVFHDALKQLNSTQALLIPTRSIVNPRETLAALCTADDYWSILDMCADTTYPHADSSISYCSTRKRCDVTTLEAARAELSDEYLADTLRRVFASDIVLEAKRAQAFFEALELAPADKYRVEILSGADKLTKLEVLDSAPWMEICGPLNEGDIRFMPGAELFYSGEKVNGTLVCIASAFNLLPLRSTDGIDVSLYEDLLALGQLLEHEEVQLNIEDGRVVGIKSSGRFATDYMERILGVAGLDYVVEVGIGLSDQGHPLVRHWGATTNEAATGVHIGLGADPTATSRFPTKMHLDFVCPHVDLLVNGARVLSERRFACD